MLNSQSSQSGALNMAHLNKTAVNVVEAICSVIAAPVEFVLRPNFGTRYFALPIIFFSSSLMIGLPLLSMLKDGIAQMIPFAHPVRPTGLFGIEALAKLFFLLLIVHGVRLYRLILNVSRETHSRYEGPPLPVFPILPGGTSFWRVRTVLEPVAVVLIATAMQDLFIFQPGLALYLQCAALALAMKSCISFFSSWEAIRDVMDAASAAPLLSKLVDNQATQEDLAPIHLAAFPQDLPDSVRTQAAVSIARAYAPTPSPEKL